MSRGTAVGVRDAAYCRRMTVAAAVLPPPPIARSRTPTGRRGSAASSTSHGPAGRSRSSSCRPTRTARSQRRSPEPRSRSATLPRSRPDRSPRSRAIDSRGRGRASTRRSSGRRGCAGSDPRRSRRWSRRTGPDPGVLRPTWHGEPGWPKLVRSRHLEAFRAPRRRTGCRAICSTTCRRRCSIEDIELGDPASSSTAPRRGDLPPYDGPPEPPAGHVHEWGDESTADGQAPPRPGRARPLTQRPEGARRRPAAEPPDRQEPLARPVASAMPPIDEHDPRELPRSTAARRAGPSPADGHDRLDSRIDRGDDRGQARQRDRDQQVAERLRGDPEEGEPGSARRPAA